MRFVRNSLALALVCLALLSGCEGLSVDTVKRVAADVAGSGDTGTAAEDTADDVADTAADTAPDTAADTTTDTADDTGVAAANGCGGTEPLAYRGAAASPGDACGLCGDGELFCSGTSGLSCAGASLPNACGGCGLVEGEIGTACGLCGDGVWACGAGQAECVGDRPWNACAGCAPLAEEPGTECLLVGGATGLVVCVGRESSVCASLGTNACGGQGELALPAGVTGVLARPGVRYEVGCVRGVLVCNGEELEALPIEGENGCGGCEPLAGTPGGACGACGGVWTCDVDGGVRCVGGAANACGGCAALTSEPGLQCDAGGNAGITICISLEETACVVPGSTNACGGLGSLTGAALGATCGPCSDGVVVCDAADPRRRSTLCETVSSSANACGGCGLLDGIPGSACGTCGLGLLACNATDDGLDCTGNPGASALNACGGCSTLAAAPSDLCGRCGLWGCDPDVVGRLRCDEPAAGCASVAVCGNAAVESGEACDDGNSVTEECLYGERTCSICDATCQTAAGRASFCGDGALDLVEVCDEGGANGTGACAISCDCSAGYHVELGACVSDTRSCVIANGTGSQNWTGSAYGSCTVSSCNATYHIESGACVSDTRSCTLANATAATQAWDGSAYGTCTATACAATYHVEFGACVSDTRSCLSLPLNASAGTESWTGSGYGTCTATACASTYHVESGACLSDTRSCSLANATTATQSWTGSAYGSCTVSSCSASYHIESGACVSDTRSCSTADGTGSQSWTGSGYGPCSATTPSTAPTIAGEVIVSEFMTFSIGGTDNGEWVELHNTTTAAFDIRYCILGDGTTDAHTIARELIIPAGGYRVLARSADPVANHGLTPDYVYSGFSLRNTTDSIILTCGGTEIDRRDYTAADVQLGISRQLDSDRLDGVANDVAANWCESRATYGTAGKFGTPGAANDSCLITTCDSGYHVESGACVSDTRSCSIANGTGSQSWTGDAYGTCTPVSCDASHHIESGACVSDTRSCSIANGTGIQSWTGAAYENCTPVSCDASYHIESGACLSDTRSCTLANATAATESWTGTGYGVCIISACSAGYALVANSCVGGCGNGVIGSGETCDDGNSVTEVCNYGELACRVCDATCQFVSGVTAYCSDGLLHPTEFCDDGNNNDADACNNSCACGAGFHAEGGVCTTNQRVCIINNRTGAETWNVITGTYGSCIAPVCGDGHLIDLGSIGFPVGARVVISDTLWGSSDDLAGGCGANSGAEDVVVFVAPTTGDYVARTAFLGTIADTSVRILSDCGAAESQIACGAEGAAVGDWRGEVAFSAIAGLTYYLLVEAERGTEAPYVLEVSSVPVVTAATARYLTATNVAFSIAGVDVDQDVASIDVYAVATTGGVLPPTAERSLVATFVRSGLSYNPTAGFSTNLELPSALGSTVTSVELVAVDAAGNKSAPFAIAAPLYTAPTAVASGATCDPTQQLNVCTAPQACNRQSNGTYLCAATSAPSLAVATVTRVDLTTATVRLTGFDRNADVTRFRAEFYTASFGRLGQIEGNLSATLLGQANYDVTFPLTGVNGFPTATQIRLVAIDQRGLVSNQLAAPLAGFADRTAGQLCDPSGIANRCATGLSCQPKQDGGNACIAPAEPVFTGFAASIAEPGLAVFGPVSGFDADGGLTTLVVEWSLSGGGIIRQEYPISGFSFLVSGIHSFVGVAPISVSFTVVDALGNRVSATVPALADTGAPAVP